MPAPGFSFSLYALWSLLKMNLFRLSNYCWLFMNIFFIWWWGGQSCWNKDDYVPINRFEIFFTIGDLHGISISVCRSDCLVMTKYFIKYINIKIFNNSLLIYSLDYRVNLIWIALRASMSSLLVIPIFLKSSSSNVWVSWYSVTSCKFNNYISNVWRLFRVLPIE